MEHLKFIEQSGLQVQLVNGALRLSPAHLITAEVRKYAVEHKQEIIDAVKGPAGGSTISPTKVSCECSGDTPAPWPGTTTRPQADIDREMVESGAFMRRERNYINRMLSREPERTESLTTELVALMGRVGELWEHERFKFGWYYG